jgi:hypothetical protein
VYSRARSFAKRSSFKFFCDPAQDDPVTIQLILRPKFGASTSFVQHCKLFYFVSQGLPDSAQDAQSRSCGGSTGIL